MGWGSFNKNLIKISITWRGRPPPISNIDALRLRAAHAGGAVRAYITGSFDIGLHSVRMRDACVGACVCLRGVFEHAHARTLIRTQGDLAVSRESLNMGRGRECKF